MSGTSFDQHWRKRNKWLTHALILSGTLNIGLVATFVNFVLKDKLNPVSIEHRPSLVKTDVQETNDSILARFSALSYQELLAELMHKDLVEDGFLKRDLALACLVAFHHFNLERALGGLTLQQRSVPFGNPEGEEKIELTLYAGLADYQYQAILHYAKTEKWPLTSQGLFYELKEGRQRSDRSLFEAFYLTPEFHAASLLFSRSGLNVPKEVLTEMLIEGEWGLVSKFTAQQKLSQDLSPARRKEFLMDYIDAQSSIAAKLLAESDEEFILKRLDDLQILHILKLLQEQAGVKLLKELLVSPRSDAVLKTSAEILYSLSGEALPQPFQLQAALERFVPEMLKERAPIEIPAVSAQASVTPELKAPPPIPRKIHIVQPGDSLWKIARQYRVTIDAIVRANKLESERLRPGKQLVIPPNS